MKCYESRSMRRVSVVKNMSINEMVFLSGHATSCPTYDFKPLWHLMRGQYNMAVVERPGYGWSEKSSHSKKQTFERRRTNGNATCY